MKPKNNIPPLKTFPHSIITTVDKKIKKQNLYKPNQSRFIINTIK